MARINDNRVLFDDPRLQSLRHENNLQRLFERHISQPKRELFAVLDRLIEHDIEAQLFSQNLMAFLSEVSLKQMWRATSLTSCALCGDCANAPIEQQRLQIKLQQGTVPIGVTFKLHIQRLHAQSEQPRRLGLTAAALAQSGSDQVALEIVNDPRQVNAFRRN